MKKKRLFLRRGSVVFALLPLCAAAVTAQQRPASPPQRRHLEIRPPPGREREAPRTVIVRPDSSASYGEETVRWRMQGDSLWLAIGGEWAVYGLRVRGNRMTLSGGDLTDPITFDRTGPPSARPADVAIPPDPRKRSF